MARVSRLAAGAVVEPGVEGAEAPLLVEPSGSAAKCSFCGKQTQQVQRLVATTLPAAAGATPSGKAGDVARICNECLELCEEILAETASS